jgi:hypothetical protein
MIQIDQKPKYQLLPVGQNVIFTISDPIVTANETKIKFIAEVYISQLAANIISTSNLAATLKVVPNNSGAAIFDLRPIIESYVSAEYLGGVVTDYNSANFSSYKTTAFSDTSPHPVHLIDKFSTNRNCVRFFAVRFKVQYLGADSNSANTVSIAAGNQTETDNFLAYNGVLQYEDALNLDTNGNYGYDLDTNNLIMNDTDAKFLTNAPTTQYLKNTDYHTVAFFSSYGGADFRVSTSSASSNFAIHYIKAKFYNSADAQLGSDIDTACTPANGGKRGYALDSNQKLQFFGCGMGNFKNYGLSSTYTDAAYYTIQAYDDTDTAISQVYRFDIITDDCKGFENIRLTWLNRHGVWDYYSFTKKSTRTVNTKRVTYEQLGGTWNEKKFRIHGHQGGTKTFMSGAKEMLKLNTDFLSEAEASWFEELFTSPDVFIINGFQSDTGGYIRKYIEPVTVTTSSYIRKTTANDKLLQYTIDVERSKEKVIQKA